MSRVNFYFLKHQINTAYSNHACPNIVNLRNFYQRMNTSQRIAQMNASQRMDTNYHELRPNFSGIRRYSCNSLTFILKLTYDD